MVGTEKDIITCHVLNTSTGRPGVNIKVSLSCSSLSSVEFTAYTDDDGRITNWQNFQNEDGTQSKYVLEHGGVSATIKHMIKYYAKLSEIDGRPMGSSIWKLSFDTGTYFGDTETFFPLVELKFLVKEGENFHIPLLIGPFSFTTYRGS